MSAAPVEAVPSAVRDPINAQILGVSEDGIEGFVVEPFAEIAKRSGVAEPVVIERLRGMLASGVITCVRQKLKATNLAQGALVAWKVPKDCLDFAFTYMAKDDPFSGHVVIRSTDGDAPGSDYKLWTTVRVPQRFSMAMHCGFLREQVGAVDCKIMPAKRLFDLDGAYVRRRNPEPGSRSENPGRVIGVNLADLAEIDWRVLTALMRELTVREIHSDPWRPRARDAGESLDDFVRCAKSLDARGVIGRFSTALDHTRTSNPGKRIARYDALFHWRVPQGREIEAGREIGRHYIVSHAYWRNAGPEFGNVNLMAVARDADKERLAEHKFLIDEHIREAGIPILYTNVFWGGRSEMKSSAISPVEYASWCRRVGCDPRQMRASTGDI